MHRNTDHQKRIWPDLINPETGTTLELEPNETVEGLELPKGFDDPHLAEVKTSKRAKDEPKSPEKSSEESK